MRSRIVAFLIFGAAVACGTEKGAPYKQDAVGAPAPQLPTDPSPVSPSDPSLPTTPTDPGPTTPSPDPTDTTKTTTISTDLTGVTLFADACFATVKADFTTKSTDDFDAIDAAFKKGDKLLISSNSVAGIFDVYMINAEHTGAHTLRVPATNLETDCSTYATAVAVLADVDLFTADDYKTKDCTLKAGLIKQGKILLQNVAYNEKTSLYDAHLSAIDIGCKATALYYPLAGIDTKIGASTYSEPFHPMIEVYVKP